MKKEQNTPKQLVHLGTVVQSTFGLVDENGNVIPQEALTVKLPLFNADYFNKAHDNIQPGFMNLAVSYIGLNVVAIWDELFFISVTLGILRKYMPFWVANVAQSIFFTSFLYTLGFQGWSFVFVFLFALSQGYIFKKTDSLLYVLTIHLTLDLVLHLTLVYLHYPEWLPFFIT